MPIRWKKPYLIRQYHDLKKAELFNMATYIWKVLYAFQLFSCN